MAITTSAELQTALANWTARTDLTSRVPEFIALAEGMMRADLVEIINEETKSTSISINAEYVNLPTGLEGVRNFYYTAGGVRYDLKYMPEETMNAEFPDATADYPLYYCIVSGQFRFAPPPSATQTATLQYYVAFTALAAAGGTDYNWILTNWPDAYLYGALAMAYTFIQEDDRARGFMELYQRQISAIKARSRRLRHSASGMQIRPG